MAAVGTWREMKMAREEAVGIRGGGRRMVMMMRIATVRAMEVGGGEDIIITEIW
jgi:hypothetical protein